MSFEYDRKMAFQYTKVLKYAYELGYKEVNDYVMNLWNESGSAEAFDKEYENHLPSIDKICNNLCNYDCRGNGFVGKGKCKLSCENIEDILENNKR